MIPIFIGYDPRDAVSFSVLCNSIIRLSSQPVSIIPLNLKNLPMYVEKHTDGSTEFSYSRFLVPCLADYTGWAIYMDCDMLLLDDISKLWALQDPKYAVQCVQHQYSTKQSVKFLGNENRSYPRKNWSSMMLFNCEHPALKLLTPQLISSSTGSYLHQFEWLDDLHIGSLSTDWNWLPDEHGVNDFAKIIHYTLGSPHFEEYKHTPMSEYWFKEYDLIYDPVTVTKATDSRLR